MENEKSLSNYENAKIEADKIDEEIISTLQSGVSFRVEAGAGSGKTYSLEKVIDWIQANKINEYKKKKQNVICITYTNVAVNVISSRLNSSSFIIPSTIHSFAWNTIKQFQSTIIKLLKEKIDFNIDETDFDKIRLVQYTLGYRYIEGEILYLYHDDVIKLFAYFLDNKKFRKIFSDRYPLILIDEYQDSFKIITDKVIDYFISKKIGPQFGFFGDSWQTIYQMNNPCGIIENENISVICKSSNFRSAENIVTLLNKIRPKLPQISAIDDYKGDTFVVTCNDFTGARRTDRNFNGELPQDEFSKRLNTLKEIVENRFMDENESLKTLMITHRVLANQQGYEKVLEVLGERFRDGDDLIIKFFMNIVEPVCFALETANMTLLFQTLGVTRYPIASKADKQQWNIFKEKLKDRNTKSAIEVLKIVKESKLIPMPPEIEKHIKLFYDQPNLTYVNSTIEEYLNLSYSQFLASIRFLYPDAEFSTEHGVKGEEYDNVIFTIGRGWSNYQFDLYAPMLINGVNTRNLTAFERNRNLFYVCCSRSKKRLFIFVTLEVQKEFEDFLIKLVGSENYYTYESFIETYNKK